MTSHRRKGAKVSAAGWRAARQPSVSSSRGKFASSRSRSTNSVSTPSASDVKAQLAQWKKEADAKKKSEQKKKAKQQFEKALLDFKYCVGNVCYDAVRDFCAANKLAQPEATELIQFMRYAKEKGLVDPSQKPDIKVLCETWAKKRL